MLKNIVGALVVVSAAALALPGCNSGDGVKTDTGPVAGSMNDHAGDEPLAGIVRIKNVERSADGASAKYMVENVSGRDQEDLAYFVSFFFPATKGSAIDTVGDRETTPQRDLVLLRGTSREITAVNPYPRPGQVCLGTTIDVVNNEAVPVVTRGDTAGTLFLNKSLECVAMSGEDEVRESKKLWIEFENVGTRAISEIEAKAQFHDPGAGNAKVGETKWTNVRDVQPKQRTRVEFDLASLGRLTNKTFLVKVRQQSL